MKQMTFADAEYAGKRKQTRKELFLIEMDQVVPWKGLIALIEPHYPKGEGGRPAYPLMAMLRIHLMQNWFGYSDPAMEEALYETTILRQFAGLSLERIPDETTILNFRRLLEKHELAAGILGVINGYLGDRGLSLRQGTIVDATLIHAPSSTKNQDGKRDPEMHRVIKRQFGYVKVRFRGLAKNTAQLVTLFALSNLWMARRHLLTTAGKVHL
ncbi:IS5 family transposase [Pseudomonas aeruginosa]|nr:IS5 family transposase [Pseudomonas aeruginosa]